MLELSQALFALFEAKFDINNKEHTKRTRADK